MKGILFAAILVAFAGTASAGPLVFNDVTLSASALAIAGSTLDSASDGTTTSSSASVPANATASESGATASAAAASTFDAGTGTATLLAQASAQGGDTSGSGIQVQRTPGPTEVEASAVAAASFLGQFTLPGGPFVFSFDFSGAPSADGDATSEAAAHVLLLSGADTLIDEVLRGIMRLSRTVALPVGLPGLLSIEVTGSANAIGPFEAANGASMLTFSVNRVPEPAGWMLVLLALAVAFLMAPPAVEGRRTRVQSIDSV